MVGGIGGGEVVFVVCVLVEFEGCSVFDEDGG